MCLESFLRSCAEERWILVLERLFKLQKRDSRWTREPVAECREADRARAVVELRERSGTVASAVATHNAERAQERDTGFEIDRAGPVQICCLERRTEPPLSPPRPLFLLFRPLERAPLLGTLLLLLLLLVMMEEILETLVLISPSAKRGLGLEVALDSDRVSRVLAEPSLCVAHRPAPCLGLPGRTAATPSERARARGPVPLRRDAQALVLELCNSLPRGLRSRETRAQHALHYHRGLVRRPYLLREESRGQHARAFPAKETLQL